ncbi:MAG: glycosyltransferase family 39 protein [Deltaproteobacteria bacterium]|nr:glycosyltransferase family 39 protein [Deltaproteobacteria bacterium]
MNKKYVGTKKDLSYIVISIVVLFLILFPNGPFGFLPANIAIFLAIIVAYGWARQYFVELDDKIKRGGRLIEVFSVLLFFVFWFLIKVFCIHPSTTDENIYFYMAKRFSEGLLPYRDFFFAHPPIHLVIPALIFKLFGFNIVVAKLIPISASLISGVFLYRTLKELSGVVTAFAGLIYYMFSYQVLMASSDMTGVNLTIMFVSISVYYLFINKPVLAGVFSALAISTGLYSLGVLASIFIYFLISKEFKNLLRYLVSFTIIASLIFGVFYIIGGDNFILGVFKYHILKPEKIPNKIDIFNTSNPFLILYGILLNSINFFFGREFLKSVYFHSMLYIPFCIVSLSFLVFSVRDLIRRRDAEGPPFYKAYKMVGFSILAFFVFVAEYSALRELYDFYLVFLFFFMSMGASYLIKYLFILPKVENFSKAVVYLFLILIGLWMYRPISGMLDKLLFGSDVRPEGERISYTYKKPHFVDFISDIAYFLYFKDHRIVGRMEPFYRHYIWNKNLSFEGAYEIADYIRSNTKDFETITGASTIAPLLALLSDRKMAGEEIDTNAKRFKSGLMSDDDFFRKVCSDNLKYLVVTARSYFNERYVLHNVFLRNSFVQDKKFVDPSAQHFKPLEIYLFRPAFIACGLVK